MRAILYSLLITTILGSAIPNMASAFSVDDKTLNQPGNASRFSDPDEKMPVSGFLIQPAEAASASGQSNDYNDLHSARAPLLEVPPPMLNGRQ